MVVIESYVESNSTIVLCLERVFEGTHLTWLPRCSVQPKALPKPHHLHRSLKLPEWLSDEDAEFGFLSRRVDSPPAAVHLLLFRGPWRWAYVRTTSGCNILKIWISKLILIQAAYDQSQTMLGEAVALQCLNYCSLLLVLISHLAKPTTVSWGLRIHLKCSGARNWC